jgi:hypothetical protein
MAKEKYLRLRMSDSTVWDVPAKLVAESKAKHYAEEETGETSGKDYDKAYKKEFKDVMGCDDELLDWAANMMSWAEVSDDAEFQQAEEPDDPDYSDEWAINCEIIKK